MKTRKYIIAIMLCCVSYIAAQQTTWEQANQAYAAGQYQEALQLYNGIAQEHGNSSDLMYNIGNTYYKLNDVAHAIIYYRRALKIDAHNSDALFNLEMARARTKDNIEVQEQFFLYKWTSKLISLASGNQWLLISSLAFTLSLAMLLLFFFASALTARKTGFYTAIILFLFFITSLIFSLIRHSSEQSATDAVVTAGSVTLKSSPDKSGTDLFVLHQGAEVTIEEQVGDWVYVQLANSDKAWMPINMLEII